MTSFQKALSSTTGAGGDVIIPQLADQIIPFIRQKSYLRQFLVSFNQPTETYRFPKLTTGNTVYYVGEASTAPESLAATGNVELAAKKLMTAIAISAELEEDAVLPIVPVLRDDLAKAFALAEESAFLNGNTTHLATTIDPALATETNWFVGDTRLAFNGLVGLVPAANKVDAGSASLSLANISEAIRKLGIFGRDKSELLIVTSLKEESTLRQLLGINLAVNQLGLTGTALPGEIGKVWGVPVVSSNLMDVTTGTTSALVLNRNAAVIGDRRIFTLKSSDEVLLRSDQLLIVASERISFGAQYAEAIASIINIA